MLWFFLFSVILCLFLLIPLVTIGEDSVLQMSAIFSSSDQLPSSSHVYNPCLLIPHQTYYSSTNSLISVSSLCSFHNSLYSPFSSHSSIFYSFPSLSFFSWSVHTGPIYINSVVTICILHSQSIQYKYISSLIPWSHPKSLDVSCFTPCLKSFWKVALQMLVPSWASPKQLSAK